MMKTMKTFVMMLLVGMTFLSGGVKSLQLKAAQAKDAHASSGPGGPAGSHGASCD